jgi:aryl-alcohol dehydrogenase-like predicted oxidoreductase
VLVGRAVAHSRDDVQLATKFGIDRSAGDDHRIHRGETAYVKRSCEASLIRLGVEVIDLFYVHRPPETAEIEETVGAMGELVTEGKVRYLGLSEVDSDLLRRAHGVHPIAAVQTEYSLWCRTPEVDLLGTLRELGVGLVPYAPLGRGFLAGSVSRGSLVAGDIRTSRPAMESWQAIPSIAKVVGSIAASKGITAAQVALAWVHAQQDRLGVPVVPIPGTKQVTWLEQNAQAPEVGLTEDELATLDGIPDRSTAALQA